MQLQPALFSNSALASNTLTWQTSCVTEKIFSLMHQLSDCCTSNPLLQSVVLPSSAFCQNQSRHLTESFNARRSAIDTFLFRIMPCDDLLSFISDYTRLNGKYRILSCQNPDIEGFLDLLPGNKFIHHCNDGITRVNC